MAEAVEVQGREKMAPISEMVVGRVARELRRGELTVDLFERAEKLADPRLYTILWNLSWELADEYADVSPKQRSALARATRACQWDDSRSTSRLIRIALKTHNHDEFERSIRILQRRGDETVLRAVVALSEKGSPQARLMGTRVLGRMGLPNSPFAAQAVEALSKVEKRSIQALVDSARAVVGKVPADLNVERSLERARDRIAKSSVQEVRELIEGTVYLTSVVSSVDGLFSTIETQLLMIRAAAVRGLTRYEALVREEIERPRGEFSTMTTTSRAPASRVSTPRAASKKKSRTTKRTGAKRKAKRRTLRPHKTRWMSGGALVAAGLAVVVAMTALSPSPDFLEGIETSSHLVRWDRPSAQVAFRGQAARDVLAQRKSCWMLYHRTELESAAKMVAKSRVGVKASSYHNLVDVLGEAVDEEQYNPVSLFVSYVGYYNGRVASRIIKGVLEETSYFSQDDLVRYIGGAVKESAVSEQLKGQHVYSPILRRLDPNLRWEMANILRSGWLSEKDRGLEHYLRSLTVPRWAERSQEDRVEPES